jgi:hypothetical protein
VEEEMSLEISFTVGQRIRGRMKYKRVPYITLKHMTFDQYRQAKEVIMADLPHVAVKFISLGYHLEYRGKVVTSEDVPSVDQH